MADNDEKIYLGSKDQITEILDTDAFIIATSDGIRKMTKAQVMEKLGINELKELENDFSQLSEEIKEVKEDSTRTGISDDLKSAMINFFTNVQTLLPQLAYVSEDNIGATLITNAQAVVTSLENSSTESGGNSGDDSSSGDDSGSEETDATLSSISVTYTGGEVTVGTALTDLTGITVTATYSDGSSKTVTGYTLSGTIAEGSNTITVSYGGKTATFTVTGIAEDSDETTETEITTGYTFPLSLTNSLVETTLSDALVQGKSYKIVIDGVVNEETTYFNVRGNNINITLADFPAGQNGVEEVTATASQYDAGTALRVRAYGGTGTINSLNIYEISE